MTRSPLAYPLNRSADTDVGGAADLQTDVMRFMAILSLCLVAIFALVQSIPMTPTDVPPLERPAVMAEAKETEPKPTEPVPVERTVASEPAPTPTGKPVTLARPKWIPKFQPTVAVSEPRKESVEEIEPLPIPVAQAEGFTLRFESDAALTRAVAAGHVGLYAIDDSRAQRMTVSESRISFWDASTPNAFHEMETATVPGAVIDALSRTGTPVGSVSWGVTLPGKLKADLDMLMEAHRGGSLIIGAGGDIRWESS